MRRLPLTLSLALLTSTALAPLVPACSPSNTATGGSTTDTGDAALPSNQVAGQPCDPTLASPCFNGNPCDKVICDTTQDPPTCLEELGTGPCVQPVAEGGAFNDVAVADVGASTNTACVTSSDCPRIADGAVTLVCAYSAFDGCASTGECVVAEPPRLTDGAVEVACGCNGLPVPYVTYDQTAAPVSSPGACVTPITTLDSGNPHDAAADSSADATSDGSASSADAAAE